MNLAKWNNQEQSHPQDLLDTAIHDINIEINRFNTSNNAITPWLARDVHHNIKGKKKNRYDRLSEDGVHLSDNLKLKWAAEIVSALVKNHEKMILEDGTSNQSSQT